MRLRCSRAILVLVGGLARSVFATGWRLIAGASIASAQVPKELHGSWVAPTVAIRITANTTHVKGYNCVVKRVKKSTDTTSTKDPNVDALVYIVHMMSQDDGYQAPPPEKVDEVWALRSVNGESVLVIAGASSIHAFKRDNQLPMVSNKLQ